MKSWTCVEKCGACCQIDLKYRKNLTNILSQKDIDLIKSMTRKDGWCKHFDKNNKKCRIYESRPHFCKVSLFSMNFKEYKKKGDDFLIDCCKEHISFIYGKKSDEMNRFKQEILKK